MITRYIKGDITQTELKYIGHGVNCMNKMGSGVAKALFTKFSEVKTVYHNKFKHIEITNYKHLLGTVQTVRSNDKTIFNCFTQEYYGYDGKKYVSYDAIYNCFTFINKVHSGEKLAIPRIGAGLAG